MKKDLMVITCITIALFGIPGRAQAIRYEARVLPLPTGYVSSYAYANNNCGQVAGQVYDQSGSCRGIVWNPDGTMTLLKEQMTGVVAQMNDSGYVLGYAMIESRVRAVVWHPDGSRETLPLFPGYLYSSRRSNATGINNAGSIVGWAEDQDLDVQNAIWNNGNISALPGSTGRPADINNEGQIIGNIVNGSGSAAFLSDPGSDPVPLGRLPGASECSAYALSENGFVTGTSSGQVFLWSLHGGMVATGINGRAVSVNDAGTVVGYFYVGSPYRAFAWQQDTGVIDLGTLGKTSSSAWSINAAGEIAGGVFSASDDMLAVVWTPVPEPSTVIILLCGIGAIACRRRRQLN